MSKPFEKATDDLRQVKHIISSYSNDPFESPRTIQGFECVKTVQRRYIVQDGPIFYVVDKAPPEDDSLWMHVPGLHMHWTPVKSEWRDLPEIFDSELKT